MNPFFTEEEKKNIFRRSCWMQALPKGERWQPDEGLFMEWLDRICAASPKACDEEAAYLFGKAEDPGAADIFFLPFMAGLIQSVHVPDNRAMIRPGAFGQWPEAFMQSLRELFVLCGNRTLSRLVGEVTLPTDAWIRERVMPVMQDGSYLRALAQDWPIAFRQMVEFTAREAAHAQELADAVCLELPMVWKDLGEKGEAPAVVTVEASGGDRHRGGRSVHLLRLEDGRRLVYKPHSMAIDRAFGHWVHVMAQRAGLRPFRTVISADTEKGGFCTFVEAVPLQDLSEAAVYFERTGFLLGLVYVLRGMDLHGENIVACGEDPVIIDMETMLMPPGCLSRRWTGDEIPYSINQMSILPMLMSLPGLREQGYACLLDARPGTHNLPLLDGKPVSGAEYAKEIGEGFRLALQTVLQDRAWAEGELRSLFTGCGLRMVIRPTAVYCRILEVLCSQNLQQDAAAYCHLIRRATRRAKAMGESAGIRVEKAEREALDRLDVPYFEEQITEEMLRDLAKEWEQISPDKAERETEKLTFCLRRISPKHEGIQEVHGEGKSGFSEEIIRDRLRKQARSICRLLGMQVTPLAVPQGKNASYTAGFGVLLREHCLLDGNFGAVVALCAYLQVCPEDEEIRAALSAEMEELTDPQKTGAGLTAAEPGLADGAAGFLLGSCMCREMGMLTEQAFCAILSNMEPLAADSERIRYGREDFLHGVYGLRYAIARVPIKWRSPQLCQLDAQLQEMMDRNPAYRELTEPEKLQKAAQSKMVKVLCGEGEAFRTTEKASPDASGAFAAEKSGIRQRSVNDTLRFGNAGRLYRITQEIAAMEQAGEDTEGLRERGRELAFALSGAAHVLRDVSFPEDYLETGLLHGMPGVLYSVCRFLNPEKVPSL